MTRSIAGDLCRILVIAPEGSVEVAIPANVPLADLLPALLPHLGGGLPAEAVGRGVVLQRLGEPPLDDEQTPAVLGLRDGDTVHLRVRDAAAPALRFDDLIDGVASHLRERAGRWSPAMTRQLFLALALVALGAGLGALVIAGPARPRAVAAGTVGATLLLAAVAAGRGFGDRVGSVLLGCAAVPYAAVCGFLLVAAAAPDAAGSAAGAGGPGLSGVASAPDPAAGALGAAGAAAAAAVLALVGVGGAGPLFLGVATAAGGAAAGALVVATTPLSPVQAAAIVVTVGLLLSPMLPSAAFRLGGLRLPDLPTTAEEAGREVDPTPDEVVVERTAAADRYATALYLGLGAVSAIGLSWLALGPGWAAPAFAVAACALLLLRFRMLCGVWQRAAVLLPALHGAVLLVLRLARELPAGPRLGGVLLALVVLALGSLAAAGTLPRRQIRPYWGRAAELAESVLALSLLPLALAVLGVYGVVRGIGG